MIQKVVLGQDLAGDRIQLHVLLIEGLVKGLEGMGRVQGAGGSEIAAAERQLQLGGLDGKGRKCCHWGVGVGGRGS